MTVSSSLALLDLSFSNISGAIPVLSVSLINSEILVLTLYSCSLNDKDLSKLGVAVSHPDCKLIYLHLSENNFLIEFTAFLRTLFNSQLQIVFYDKS